MQQSTIDKVKLEQHPNSNSKADGIPSSPNNGNTLVSCCFVGGLQDTRNNKEDFALTPYLFGVFVKEKIIKVFGFGICWGWYSIYIGLGFNIPKKYTGFRVLSKNSS